jgi:photosystem II stability/assembly factor-like uncharacterized protein
MPASHLAVLTGTFRLPLGAFSVATGAGAAWVTTGEGVLRIDPGSDRTSTLLSEPGAAIEGVAFGAGSVWVRDAAGVMRVSPITGRTLVTIPIEPLLLSFGDGALWTLSIFHGLLSVVRIDPGTDRVRAIALPFGKPSALSAGDGAVWVAGFFPHCRECLLRIDPVTGAVVARTTDLGFPATLAAGDGAVWAADSSTVERIDPRTLQVAARVQARSVRAIATAPGIVWLASPGRLARIDPATDRLAGDELPIAGTPESLAASGRTAWVVSDNERLSRVDVVPCAGFGRCEQVAPAPANAQITPAWLYWARMSTPQVGWALRWTANPGIVDGATLGAARTVDGGHTWVDVTPAAARRLFSPAAAPALFALDANHAWLAVSLLRTGGRGRVIVFATADGGVRWKAPPAVDSPGPVKLLDFLDQRHGWLLADLGAAMQVERVTLLSTSDGGHHWQQLGQPFQSVPVTGMAFVTATSGWLAGYYAGGDPAPLLTRDGGRTWSAQTLPLPPSGCNGGCQASSPQFFGSVGYLAISAYANRPVLLTSNDGGAAWSPLPLPSDAGPYPQIQFVDRRHGFLVPEGPQGRP